MIHVLATINVRPGGRQAFLKEFHAVMPEVHGEVGCREYRPAVDTASGLARQIEMRPDTVVIIEKWDTLDALRAHLAAPHMAAYRERVKDLVVSAQLQVLQDA